MKSIKYDKEEFQDLVNSVTPLQAVEWLLMNGYPIQVRNLGKSTVDILCPSPDHNDTNFGNCKISTNRYDGRAGSRCHCYCCNMSYDSYDILKQFLSYTIKRRRLMIIDVTYACNMGYSHCMSDCTPDGLHMPIQTFRDSLNFLQTYKIPTWNFSGGEMFEHPQIMEILDVLEFKWTQLAFRCPICFITNGRKLARDREVYARVTQFIKRYGNRLVLIQVTDDPRFYPDPLSKQEKYWLNKLGAIIEAVPGNPQNPQKCLYPQGRALQNFPNADWNVIGPKCANCRLLTLQNVNSISQMVTCLLQHGKVCTPVIAPNGGIKLGESALCPEVSNIYKSEAAIIQDIRQCTCQKCEIAWDNLKKVHPTAYYLCGGK